MIVIFDFLPTEREVQENTQGGDGQVLRGSGERKKILIGPISGMAIPPIFGQKWPNIGYKAKRPGGSFKSASKSEKAKIWEDEVI